LLTLRRISSSESTPRRFATPTTFRPQGFAPSRRFTPRSNVRPYFMPVTPMGFPLSRDLPSLSGSTDSSPGNCPPGVSPPQCTVNSASQGHPISANSMKSSRHEPLSPSRLCSDSESVPPLDCYIRCHGRFPPELSTPLQGLNPSLPDHATRHVFRSYALSISSSISLGQVRN